MKRRKILPSLLGFTLLAIALPLALSSRAKETAVPERPHVQRVQVQTVEAGEASRTLRFSGVLRAEHRAQLSFPFGGRLSSRSVAIGDRVEAGQSVALLNDRKLRNTLSAAAGNLAEIEARQVQMTLETSRVERLVAAGAATQEELEQVSAAQAALSSSRDAARARRDEASRVLREASLIAPFAGTVSRVALEPGEYAGAGKTVVEISGDGPLEVELGVPEGWIRSLSEGQEVQVDLPLSSSGTVPGHITSITRAGVGSGRLFPVVVSLEARDGISAGMTTEVAMPTESGARLTVPLGAILNPGGSRPTVFRLAEDRAERIAVEVEMLLGDRVAVAGALQAGDQVVTSGLASLVDGDAVEVVR
ncbi:MAG: efflux RND transporter periplasmic adaptor subunit [Deltaproteobacteria bacterium]|nr:efflux RND transporter periplasmic adaptor subunit [Deltaproteobacteria bacterium]